MHILSVRRVHFENESVRIHVRLVKKKKKEHGIPACNTQIGNDQLSGVQWEIKKKKKKWR